ncbi:NAD-dependent epimerase/dehydratase family protein [soil metagenome]
MKILILGGTRFLGRHLAQQALDAGHHVTLLHRGHSGPALFAQAEHRIADRDDEAALLGALAAGAWDAAIDTSAYFPRQVRAVATALAGRVGQYQLVSTISVYAGFDGATTEGAARQTLGDAEAQTVVTGANYGGLKALCEDAAWAGFGEQTLVSRPGLLVGPQDPTGRFTWWTQRFLRAAAGDDNEVLAPGDPAGPVQFIDVRDAAAWMLLQATAGGGGSFNLTGPAQPLSFGDFLSTAQRTLAPASRLLWVDEAFLLEQGVAPWSDLPVWLPARDSGLHRVDIGRALASGLHCRPLGQTLADTAAWAADAPAPIAGAAGILARAPAGLAPEREAALRAEWQTRRAA